MKVYDGGGSPGEHDNIYALMEAEALARGETVQHDPPDGRLVRSLKDVFWGLVTVAIVAGVVFLAGGNLATIVAAAVATVIALVVVAVWRVRRSGGRIPQPGE
jgi:TRAP-type C4-dicarboxylate transport system permease large subunit